MLSSVDENWLIQIQLVSSIEAFESIRCQSVRLSDYTNEHSTALSTLALLGEDFVADFDDFWVIGPRSRTELSIRLSWIIPVLIKLVA